MTLRKMAAELDLTVVQDGYDDRNVERVYTSDMLSDVMAHAGEADVLVTIQAHKNTVAVASLSDIAAIIVCNDREIPDDMTAAAAGEGIAIFVTGMNQYQVSGELFTRLR